MYEFDFLFPRFDILPRVGALILQLQGFGVVHIMGLDLDRARVGDLAILVMHFNFYSRIQVWLKTSDEQETRQ
jgi:hypothetical protein